jgi:hypothetical protein
MIKYMGTKLPDAAKFKYTWENADKIFTMEAGSIRYPSTV